MDLQQESLKMHLENHGKMEIRCKAPLNDRHDLAVAYTPGVAAWRSPAKRLKNSRIWLLSTPAAATWPASAPTAPACWVWVTSALPLPCR